LTSQDIGLLTGDPASHILWSLFLADLVMMPDRDDVFLAGIRISLLAQADDILLFSISTRGLQAKLVTLKNWCARNFILINMVKTIILIFGKIPQPISEFTLGSTTLEKYVGVTFRTDAQNILEAHYKAKARTAR
jgi:hypothetical protein